MEFDSHAFDDLSWWIENDKKTAIKITKLIDSIMREPEKGPGRPEKLKHALAGCWSRRINSEHRIVYQILQNKIRILSCKYHYDI